MTNNKHYGAREVYSDHRPSLIATNSEGGREYTLEQARDIAIAASRMENTIKGQVLNWRRIIGLRVMEVYKNGERKR